MTVHGNVEMVDFEFDFVSSVPHFTSFGLNRPANARSCHIYWHTRLIFTTATRTFFLSCVRFLFHFHYLVFRFAACLLLLFNILYLFLCLLFSFFYRFSFFFLLANQFYVNSCFFCISFALSANELDCPCG